MGKNRADWHSGLTYEQTCQTCGTVVQYTDESLEFCDWFEEGFLPCPKCRQPLRHSEDYAVAANEEQTTSTFCIHCGKPLNSNSAFCIYCGGKVPPSPKPAPKQIIDVPAAGQETVPVAPTAFCTHCGRPLNSNSAFCTHCGNKQQEAVRPAVQPVPAAVQPAAPALIPMPAPADPMSYFVPDTYDPSKYDDLVLPEVDEKGEKKLLGVQGMFLKGEKREAMLTSKLVEQAIKEKAKAGEKLSKEEIEKIKFARDPVFKQKVIEKVHSDCDKEYNQNIKNCENAITSLEKAKTNEIKRIEESRWTGVAGNLLRYNLTEGKVLINNSPCLFSSIKGAGANIHESYRVVTEESGQSRRRASVGGAVVGGLMFGAVGAMVGGTALGKTKHQTTTNVNQIPTASHVGVVVNVDGFQNEILLLNKTVDQDSREFTDALKKAQELISVLQYLSTLPVPRSYLLPEQEQSVINLQQRIYGAIHELNAARANVPKYEIPPKYL